MLLKDKRAGILAHISSLYSKESIGTLGKGAYAFVDFLRSSGQTFWQILPLNPVGAGNSPYQSPCSFAGETLFIDLDLLREQNLLEKHEIGCYSAKDEDVNYENTRKYKIPLLLKAAGRFDRNSETFKKFCEENGYWLEPYAEFVEKKECIAPRITKVLQFFFFKQWNDLKNYANKKGIYFIGDIPFYVAPDSSDVKGYPHLFKVGKDFTPTLVAGVPPDYFSEDGQLWGNPIYNWDQHRLENYSWWMKRLAHCKKLYDVIRIDHFRAFSSYYSIPYGHQTARNGTWEQGVGYSFFEHLEKTIGKMNIVAEDLGELSPDVPLLLKKTGFPGMKVLQFAFDGNCKNPFLPRFYPKNCVCYTGTHDNDTTLGWYESLSREQKKLFLSRTPTAENAAKRLILYAFKSRANTVIIPMQDWLALNSKARMNTPGTVFNNWQWRMKKKDISKVLSSEIKQITTEFGR